jgi:hypothetical protein
MNVRRHAGEICARRSVRWVVALVLGLMWWWAVLRMALQPGRPGPVEEGVAAGGWTLSVLPVRATSRQRQADPAPGSGGKPGAVLPPPRHPGARRFEMGVASPPLSGVVPRAPRSRHSGALSRRVSGSSRGNG